jgi:hypothetical protein
MGTAICTVVQLLLLQFGGGLTTVPWKNLLQNHGGGQDRYRIVAPVKKYMGLINMNSNEPQNASLLSNITPE